MAYTLIPISPGLVRSPILLEEAYGLLEAADPRSPAVDMNDAIDIRIVARRWLAAHVLHDGIVCFVWSPSVGWFRIPRRYWWKPEWTMDELVNRVGLNPLFDENDVLDAPDDLRGQNVVVWREAIEALIAINRKPPPGPPSIIPDRAASTASRAKPIAASTVPSEGGGAKAGRPTGSRNYPNDRRIVNEIIAACDKCDQSQKGFLRRAIRARILEIDGGAITDDAKIKRIRDQVLVERPDLKN